MTWVATNTGKVIDLMNPDPDQITIEDIANNLSKICRFNGQLRQWYSVAEHCIRVSELVPKPMKLQALLHDAAEGYICDIPTPLKRLLGKSYSDVEDRILAAIEQKFQVDLVNLHDTVKLADRMMVVTERDTLQDKPRMWGADYENVPRYPFFSVKCTTPGQAAAAYLAKFGEYKNL